MDHTITVSAGNTIVVLATQAIRAGSPTGLTISATNGISCQVAVNNNNHADANNQIAISICPVLTHAGATTIQAQSAGACGGGNPCGFMGLYIYEILGSAFHIVNSTGNNAKASTSTAQINSTAFTGPALIIGADSVDTALTTQTVGAGFVLGTCFTSGVNSAVYACVETASGVASGSTTVPFNLNQASSWADEAVILESTGPSKFFAIANAAIPNNGLFPQRPILNYILNGTAHTLTLQITNQTVQVDNNSAWSTTNPFFYNNAFFIPSPASGTITGNNSFIHITYTSQSAITNGACVSNSVQDFEIGQWLCGAAFTYGNLIGMSWFFGIIAMLIPGMIYLKSGNAGLTLLVLVVTFGLFGVGVNNVAGNFLPGPLQTLGLGVTIVGIAGILYKLWAGRGQ